MRRSSSQRPEKVDAPRWSAEDVRRVARSRGSGSFIVQARPEDLDGHLDGVHVDATVAPLTVPGVVAALQEIRDRRAASRAALTPTRRGR